MSARFARVRFLVATGFGAGWFPWAPGTVGALLGVLLYVLAQRTGGFWAAAATTLIVLAAGLATAGSAGGQLGSSDPGPVVVDEIAGQLIALAGLPPAPRVLLAAFLLFRFFDIVKPPPIRQLEALPGASGIMADDVAAGICTAVVLHVLAWAAPQLLGLR